MSEQTEVERCVNCGSKRVVAHRKFWIGHLLLCQGCFESYFNIVRSRKQWYFGESR